MSRTPILGRPDYTFGEKIRFALAMSIGTVIVAICKLVAFATIPFRSKKNAP